MNELEALAVTIARLTGALMQAEQTITGLKAQLAECQKSRSAEDPTEPQE
jgi:uncharacterized small protein (DUF1192 family)